MKNVLLGLLTCLLTAALANADGPILTRNAGPAPDAPARGPSHVPLPKGPNESGDTEQLFQERFGRSETMTQLRAKLKELLGKNPNQAIDILRQIKIDPNSPEFAKQLQEAMKNPVTGQVPKLSKEQMEAARKLWQDLFPKNGSLPKLDPPNGTTPPADPKTPTDPTGKLPATTPTPDPAPKTPPTPTPPPPSERQRDIYDWLLRRVEGLEGLGKSMNDSPALREMVHDLSRYTLDRANAPAGATGIDARLAQFGDAWDRNASWLEKGWSLFGGIELPGAPEVRMPSMDVNLGTPSWRAPSANHIGSVGSVLLWLFFLAALGVVLWKLLNGRLPFLAGRGAEDGWRLGPWPVRPEDVATREELVRGFEHLSLLLLGRQARVWNHHEIAGRLAASEVAKKDAAVALASAYEKARYAPADEPLSAETLAAARRDLCLLAGVAGV